MPISTSRATFLGLPTELRLRVYDYTIHTDTKCSILKDIQHISGPTKGTQAILMLNPEAKIIRSIPWLNLRLTCKTVHYELESFMADAVFMNNEQNHTYVLDLDVSHQAESKPRRPVTWRSLPCPPTRAKVLIINVAARPGPGPWTEGGAASLARALYQIFNHLFHNGPRLVADQQLPDHMRLRHVIINVDKGLHNPKPAVGCNSEPQFNYDLFFAGFVQISRTGLLFGYVDKIRLCSSRSREELEVGYKARPAVLGAWQNYGFGWGV